MDVSQLFDGLTSVSPKISATVGLAVVATFGYVIGRRSAKSTTSTQGRGRQEVKRARSVARELDQIAGEIRKHLNAHRNSVSRFKERIGTMSITHEEEAVQRLCKEAEDILYATQRLTMQMAHSYDGLRGQITQLTGLTEARTDPLTGLSNRRAMDDALRSLLAMYHRYDQSFAVAMFDIDRFKQINDANGHVYGDRVLQGVASLLADGVRESDSVSRFGGEEFVVLLPQTGLEEAATLAERLRESIANTLMEDVKLTISGGITIVEEGDQADNVLTRADTALYHAKSMGRNRIAINDGENLHVVGDVPQTPSVVES